MNLITLNNTLFAFSKDGIRQVAMDMVSRVQNGEVSGIDALIYVKKAAELFGEAEKNIRPIAESQYHLAKGEKQNLHNVEIIEAETGVKYDYAACNDLEWLELNTKAENIKEALKERESFLKTVTKVMIVADSETGESWEIHPPVRSGKLGLKLTLK